MGLTMNRKIGGIDFDIKFDDRVCIMMGFSGTGKTFLLKTLMSCLSLKNISCLYISPDELRNLGVDEDSLEALIYKSKPRVILFDNASFYLTNALAQAALTVCEFIIIGTNYLTYVNLGKCGYYDLDFEGNILRVRRESYV